MSTVTQSNIEIKFSNGCAIDTQKLLKTLCYFEWDQWGGSSSWQLVEGSITFNSFAPRYYPTLFPPIYEGFSQHTGFVIDESKFDEGVTAPHNLFTLSKLLSQCISGGFLLMACEFIDSNQVGEQHKLIICDDSLGLRIFKKIGINSDGLVEAEWCDSEATLTNEKSAEENLLVQNFFANKDTKNDPLLAQYFS